MAPLHFAVLRRLARIDEVVDNVVPGAVLIQSMEPFDCSVAALVGADSPVREDDPVVGLDSLDQKREPGDDLLQEQDGYRLDCSSNIFRNLHLVAQSMAVYW